MVKNFKAIFCLLTVLALLAGCSGGGGKTEEDNSAADIDTSWESTITEDQKAKAADAESVLNFLIGTYDVSPLWMINTAQRYLHVPVGNEVIRLQNTAKIDMADPNFALYNPYERIQNHVSKVGETKVMISNTEAMSSGVTMSALLDMDGGIWIYDAKTTIVNRYDKSFLSRQEFQTGLPESLNVIRYFYSYDSKFMLLEDPSQSYDSAAQVIGTTNLCNIHWFDLAVGASGEFEAGKLDEQFAVAYPIKELEVLLLKAPNSLEGAKVFNLQTRGLTDFTGSFGGNTFTALVYDQASSTYYAMDADMNLFKATELTDSGWNKVYSFPAAGNELTDSLRAPIVEMVMEAAGLRLISIPSEGKVLGIQMPKAWLTGLTAAG